MAYRYRKPRASPKHAIEALRGRRRVLARGQRLDVVARMRATLRPETCLRVRTQAWQYCMLSVVGYQSERCVELPAM